jgi:hypothetical protein
MTYAEHQAGAVDLSPPEVDNLLRALGRDDRFCAVVAWLERNREGFVNAGSRQDISGDHGRLAHAQGSVHAINTLAAQLANLLNPQPVQGGMTKPADV